MSNELTEYLARIHKKIDHPMRATIREEECIGCLKCLRACPVDAIVGAPKQMHTVINAECTGCELCVTPCPVDCIDMVPLPKPTHDLTKVRMRFEARTLRLSTQKKLPATESVATRKKYILGALARVKAKRKLDEIVECH